MRADVTLTMVTLRPSHQRAARAAAMVDLGIIRRERACEGKTRYANQNDARHAAKLVMRETERQVTTYRCPFCEGFHITKLKHGESEG